MQLSSQARKAMAAGLAASTLLMGVAGLVPQLASAAVHSEGCLVLSGGTVWMITGGTRRGYTSAEVFQSWGRNFSEVVVASTEDVALPVGPIQVYADGTLLKGPNDPLVYLVTGGQKRPFTSGAVFTGLGFSFANIQSAPVNTFQDLPTGANLDSSAIAHPAGVQVISNGAIWWMDAAGRRGFTTGAQFNSYGYMFSHVVQANAMDLALPNLGDVPNRAACTGGDTTPPPTSGSVTLASDNPASSTLVATQAQADLAHFQFGSLGTVSSITLERIGVSANTTLSNIYLFNGSTRLTDSATMGSDNKVTFAGLSLSTPVNVSVKSDILTGTQGQTVGVKLAGYTANSTAYNASVSGNIHTIAQATLATVALSAPAGGGATDPGNDINVWQATVAVGTRDVVLTRLALRQIGSIQSADIRNFRLQVDGVQVAQTQSLDANGYVTFTPSTTVKNGTRTFKVVADVIGGSGRTYGMSLRGAYDLSSTDSQYNVGIVDTLSAAPFGPAAANVNAGSITVVKATDSPSANLVVGASDAAVGKWTFTAFGETMKVESLTVGIDTNGVDANNSLRNVRILVDGVQVGSTASVAAVASAATGTSFTTNFMVVPGTPRTVEVHSDMVDDTPADLIAAGTTTSVQFALVADTDNVIPQVSLTPTGAPITSNSNANALTIATGSISLARTSTYSNQSITAPLAAQKLGSWTLSGNSSEAVNINTLALGFVGTGTWTAAADLSNVYFKYGASTSSIKSTVSEGAINSLPNSYSTTFTVPVNGTVTVELWGTLGSGVAATDTLISYLRATGVTASSGTTVYADVDSDTDATDNGNASQTMTIGTSSITATKDASSVSAQLVDDSGTVSTAAFNFAASTDSFTITDVVIQIATCTAVSNIALKDGSTVLANKPCSAAASDLTFSGLNVSVAANTNKVLSVELTMSTIGVGAGTTDSSLITTLTAFTARNSNGTADASANDSGCGNNTCLSLENDPFGNAMYAYKAVPLVSQVALPNADLSASTMVVAKFTVSSNGTGTVVWKQTMLKIAKTATPLLATPTLWNADSGEAITAAIVYQNGSGGVVTTCVADNTSCEALITVGTNASDDTAEVISGARTYEVRIAITGAIASTDSVSVTMQRNTVAHVASNLEQTVDNSLAANNVSFTWSDASGAGVASATGVATWQKDYLVKNTPLTWALN